jgi:ubiquinone biosynthesis protein COQ4
MDPSVRSRENQSLQSHSMESDSPALSTASRLGRDWRGAWHAIRTLIADSERTDAVFDLIEALDGASDDDGTTEYAAHPEGGRLLDERPDLLAALCDRERLAQLPAGSFGRAYYDFTEKTEITAEGLVAADEEREQPSPQNADSDYLSKRGRDCHDLWHVLTGYGTDEAGEVSVLAFSCGRYQSLGLRVIVFAGALFGPRTWNFRWERYLWRALKRGKRADLEYARYEDWLPLPLDEVRRIANIDPPEIAHPEGVVSASRIDGLVVS